MVIILFLLPVFLQLALSPLWFLLENSGTFAFLEAIFIAVVAPLYLTIISVKRKNDSSAKILTTFLVSFAICIICSFIAYCNWGISTGNFFTPDSETVFILQTEVITAGVVLTIGMIIVHFNRNKR